MSQSANGHAVASFSGESPRLVRVYLVLPVVFLFFLSGASSLIYEILWMRMFTQVFGSTTSATSTVLSAFMAGLALGSYLIGSYADSYRRNPLKLYAYLESAIGVFGILMPFLIQRIYFFYHPKKVSRTP